MESRFSKNISLTLIGINSRLPSSASEKSPLCFLQNKKTSCYEKQNVQEIKKWAVQDLAQNAENPVFSRVEGGSADGRYTQKYTYRDKINLILSLIDSLTPEEKERLIERLESVER